MGSSEAKVSSKNSMWVSDEEKQRIQDELEKNYWKDLGKRIKIDWRLMVMIIPAFLVFLLWRYFPLYGLVGAFKNNAEELTIMNRAFVGLDHFKNLLFGVNALEFWQAFRNTFFISFYSLLFGFPMPIILAILFNEIKNNVVRSGIQVATYLPKFVSTVVVTSLIGLLLASSKAGSSPGILATALQKVGFVTEEAAQGGILKYPEYFRAIYVFSGIWETAGYDSIVFFATIIAISPTNYEAARIDGAGKMGQMRYVVIPGMLSTIIIMLILKIGQLLNVGYEKVLLLYRSETYKTADIVSTFVLRISGIAEGGTSQPNKALGSAADLMASLLSMVLVIGSNKISKKASSTSLF